MSQPRREIFLAREAKQFVTKTGPLHEKLGLVSDSRLQPLDVTSSFIFRWRIERRPCRATFASNPAPQSPNGARTSLYPIVSQLVDPAVLEKMKVRPVGEAEGNKQDT